jgi:IS5 family transposase
MPFLGIWLKWYAKKFPSKRGAPALTVRMALGALIIKEKLGLTDLETVEQIKENPYLQYCHRTGRLSI